MKLKGECVYKENLCQEWDIHSTSQEILICITSLFCLCLLLLTFPRQ